MGWLVALLGCRREEATSSAVEEPLPLEGPDCSKDLEPQALWDADLAVADLATFCEGYCARSITGSLELFQTEIEDLAPLACLTEIGGTLGLYGNESLTSLSGLRSLSRIGGNVVIWGSPISDLSGLDLLEVVDGDVTLSSLDDLQSLSGLGSLAQIGGSLSVSTNPSLVSLSGPGRLERVGRDLLVVDNASLVEISGLQSLSSIDEELFVFDNDALTSLAGLSGLERVEEGVGIHGNDSLPSFSGLESLSYAGRLEIGARRPVLLHPDNLPGNAALSDVTALYGLAEVHGDIAIADNPELTPEAIDALVAEIEVIGGGVFILD